MAKTLPASWQIRAQAELLRRQRAQNAPRQTFEDFVRARNRFGTCLADFEHAPRLIDVAQRVVDGDLKRVLVMLPPRYMKSETFSRLLPAYALSQHPEWHVGLASYGAALAWELSEEAKNYYEEGGGRVSADTSAKRRWRVDGDRGEMWADGVGGALLGRGYHLGIVDDPQDPLKAHSPTFQKTFRDWWPSKFLSRQEPDAAIVVVMQRLGPGDPIEFLFEREGESPENWHVVVCDEIKSSAPLWRGEGEQGLPATCALEPDPREEGDVLAPSRFSLEDVLKAHKTAGPVVANAQRQQRPTALTGDFWQESWFRVHHALPDDAYNHRFDWDTAYTKNEKNAATAYVETYRGKGGPDEFVVYVEDCDWAWYEWAQAEAWLRGLPGPHYVEDKASGKSLIQSLRTKVAMHAVKVTGDKFARASQAQPVVSQLRVSINARIVDKLLRGSHSDPKRSGRQGLLAVTAESLTTGNGDLDLNDAFAQAVIGHSKPRRTGKGFGASF